MRVTTKGSYGLRAMVDLASQNNDRPILIAAIAERQDLSRKYLHALLTSLKAASLVRSVRGSKGGYLLARDPADISVGEVLRALEGPVLLRECMINTNDCERRDGCVARKVWLDLNRVIDEHLDGLTLKDLVDWRKPTD